MNNRSQNTRTAPNPLIATWLLALLALTLSFAILTPRARASFGVEKIEALASNQDGSPDTQAASHPYALTIAMTLDRKPLSQLQREDGLGDSGPLGQEIAEGDPKNVETTLPAGVMVDLLGVPRCPEQQLARQACQAASQVGVISIDSPFPLLSLVGQTPVFNIAPSSPKVAGALGFTVGGVGFIAHLVGSDHSGGDYGISALVSGIPQVPDADGLTLTLWGEPSAPSHCHQTETAGPCVAVPQVAEAFLTMPTACPTDASVTEQQEASVSSSADSWQEPGNWTPLTYSAPLPALGGCERLSFTPSIEVQPETTTVDEPTGVSIVMKLPQNEAAGSLAEPTLREALISLPSGLAVSPSAASGLDACSEAQVALERPAPSTCPGASRIGTVEAFTPLLDHPVFGSVYIAQQGNGGQAQGSNPFGALLAIYIVVEGNGVQIKLAGEVNLNQATGQITARFPNLPQVPYSTLEIRFFGGPRAALVPVDCGTLTTTTMLTPWSAPQSGVPATPQSSFTVSSGCGARGFTPGLEAGTTSNQAGSYGSLVEDVSLHDREQEFFAIQQRLPKGLIASLSHVQLCGEPQAQQGTCGPESEVGQITVQSGPGPEPLQVAGKVYLTGPYDGAPFGISVAVPAVAGPFNLGMVVVRLTLSIDPKTAEAIATSVGPLPHIFQGIPLHVKGARITIDRPRFIFNPTSCERKSISTSIEGTLGAVSSPPVSFQAGDCASLQFKPKLALYAAGHASRQNGVGVDVKLTTPGATASPGAGEATGGAANFAKVHVELPRQLPARLTTIQKACPAKTFEADPAECPAASVVAIARASTPVLPTPLSGPAYFVSFGNQKFPELVVVIQGYGVVADIHGETFISQQGVTSATFPALPDVPVSSFELYFPPGPDSALTANGDLCREHLTLPTKFVAQNGAELTQQIKIDVTGCAKVSARRAKKAQRAKRASKARQATQVRHAQRARSASVIAQAPLVSTGTASALTQSEATLSGSVDREGGGCSYAFELGTSTAYGTVIAGSLAATAPETQSVALNLENLAPNTTYHYRLVAANQHGTSHGADETFTTPGPSIVLTVPEAPPLLAIPQVSFPAEPSSGPQSSPTAKAKSKRRRKHSSGKPHKQSRRAKR